MDTPFQERSPCQTASYPRVRRAFTGKASCSALSSWRLTTSGSAFANQAKRLSSRLLILLMLKVAPFTKSLSVLERSFSGYGTAIPGDRPSHSSSGAEQRYTPRNVYCVFIEMRLEPCLKIRLPV